MTNQTEIAIGQAETILSLSTNLISRRRAQIIIAGLRRLAAIEDAAIRVQELRMVQSPGGPFCDAECMSQCDYCKAMLAFRKSLEAKAEAAS